MWAFTAMCTCLSLYTQHPFLFAPFWNISDIHSMTDAKGTLARGVSGAVMSSACQHLHLPTFLPLTAGSGCDKKMQHILFLTSHFSTRMCAGYFRVTPTAFCFIWVFVMDISSPPLFSPLPHIPWRAQPPFAVVNSRHPGGWAIKESPLCISHSLQGNNQNLWASDEPQPKPPATHRGSSTCGYPGWEPHHHHWSVP